VRDNLPDFRKMMRLIRIKMLEKAANIVELCWQLFSRHGVDFRLSGTECPERLFKENRSTYTQSSVSGPEAITFLLSLTGTVIRCRKK